MNWYEIINSYPGAKRLDWHKRFPKMSERQRREIMISLYNCPMYGTVEFEYEGQKYQLKSISGSVR